MITNVLLTGVGGQGTITASQALAQACLLQDWQIKKSEIHGMSQRGGSVQAHIRIAERVCAPVISPGEVDYLLAFEAAEGLRWAPALAATGLAVVSTQHIVPPLASQGNHEYPFDAIERMRGQGHRVIAVDGTAICEKIGSGKVAGIVLVGALAAQRPFAEATWRQAIANEVGAAWLPMNLAAFAGGLEQGRSV